MARYDEVRFDVLNYSSVQKTNKWKDQNISNRGYQRWVKRSLIRGECRSDSHRHRDYDYELKYLQIEVVDKYGGTIEHGKKFFGLKPEILI